MWAWDITETASQALHRLHDYDLHNYNAAHRPHRGKTKPTCCTSRRYFTASKWKSQVDEQSVTSKSHFPWILFKTAPKLVPQKEKWNVRSIYVFDKNHDLSPRGTLWENQRSGPRGWLPISNTWAALQRPMPGPPLEILSSWSGVWPGVHFSNTANHWLRRSPNCTAIKS